MALVGLKKYTIRELEPNVSNCMLVCLIISKQQAKKLNSTNFDGDSRAVWNFTVRDSPRDYINVTCWGNVNTIFSLYERFQIGDVIEIQKPRIEIRQNERADEFCPIVTSPFKLTLNDNESEIIHIRDGNFHNLMRLIHLPTKPIANYVSLANIHSNIKTLSGTTLDILVAVRSIYDVRNVKTKNGEAEVRNVSVFDSTNPGLALSIWDPEYIARASLWKPRLTILFMTDMRVYFDSYTKSAKASLSRRTIITEDPDCPEATALRNYALTAPLTSNALLDQLSCSIPDPTSINNIMNIRQIYSKIDSLSREFASTSEDKRFTALLYGVVTDLNLDGNQKLVTTRCMRCRTILTDNKCENVQCQVAMGVEDLEAETSFDIRLSISDQTGSLVNCRLTGKNAETILGCSCQDFLKLSDDEKCNLKWKYLMERCDIRLMVLCMNGRNPMITILSCKLVELDEIRNL